MKIASVFLLIMATLSMVACSDSNDAKSRKEQEAGFIKAFGFAPPAAISTIDCSDAYTRGVMDGAAAQWLSFTFHQASFEKIISKGYKEDRNGDVPTGGASPAWWPGTVPYGTVIFSRSQDDTPANEGFQFWEYIWHDSASGLVFYCASYWD